MTTIAKETLQITIHDTNAEVRRNWLIKAIAAAMRWRANYPENYQGDEESMTVLAELLEELSSVE